MDSMCAIMRVEAEDNSSHRSLWQKQVFMGAANVLLEQS